MNYASTVKRSHFIAVVLITLFFLIVLFGLVGHFFFWENTIVRQQSFEQQLAENKEELKKSIDALISGIESDFIYCSKRQSSLAAADVIETPGCERVYVVEMAKRRIASFSEATGTDIYVQKVGSYRDRSNSAAAPSAVTDRDQVSSINLESLVSDSNNIERVLRKGDLFIEDISKGHPDLPGLKRVVYTRYYQRLHWIIWAGVDVRNLQNDLEKRLSERKQMLIKRTLGVIVPLVFFTVLAFMSAYMLFLRISRAVDQHESLLSGHQETNQPFHTVFEKTDSGSSPLEREILQQIFKTGEDVILIFAEYSGQVLVVKGMSAGAEKRLGYTLEDIRDKPVHLLSQPEETNREESPFYAGAYQDKYCFSGEQLFRTKDDDNIPVHYAAQRIDDENGQLKGVFITAFDISSFLEIRKVLERTKERLLQSQKLEAIGILAGGIAHDFNNVLSSIVGYSELLKEQLAPGSVERGDLEQILHATNRAANLVKQIHAFSRSKAQDNSYFEPGLIVKETLKMLRSTIPTSVTIKQDIRLQGETIYANSTRFHQLFMNLCTNAFQAMHNKSGTLKVSLKCIDDLYHVPEDSRLAGDKFLELVVSDTGCGMPDELQQSIFKSQKTFAPEAPSVEKRLIDDCAMIKQIGGSIWFRNNDPGGTIFHVLLPVKKEPGSSDKSELKNLAAPGGSGAVLFVDDEPDIIKISKKMLRSLGYRVVCRSNGEEALETFLQNQSDFDLIITDQSMPEMTGAELVEQIRKVSSVPVILCTGYSAKISEENWKTTGVNGFIMKPFRKKDIARLIEDTLRNSERCQNGGAPAVKQHNT